MKHDNTMAFLTYHMDWMIYEYGNKNTMELPSGTIIVHHNTYLYRKSYKNYISVIYIYRYFFPH